MVRDALVTSVTWTPCGGAAGEIPDQPGIHGAERDLAPLGPFAQPGDVLQQPGRLGAGEVTGQRQAGGGAEPVLPVRTAELVAESGGTGVLPDDGVVDGDPGGPVPEHGRLALVGDAEPGKLVRPQPGPVQGAYHDGLHGGPDLGGVVFHPARAGEYLPVLALVDGDDGTVLVEDDAAAGRGALVDGGDIPDRHDSPCPSGTSGTVLRTRR